MLRVFRSRTLSSKLSIEVPNEFKRYVPAVIVRLTYLYPDCEFSDDDGAVSVMVNGYHQFGELKKEVMHQIYRERIYSETLSVRRWLSGD